MWMAWFVARVCKCVCLCCSAFCVYCLQSFLGVRAGADKCFGFFVCVSGAAWKCGDCLHVKWLQKYVEIAPSKSGGPML